MPNYEEASQDMEFTVQAIISDQYPTIAKLLPQIEFEYRFAYGRSRRGHALTKNGWPCIAMVKVMNLEKRSLGGPDVAIFVDGDWWHSTRSERRKEAVLSHELYHLLPQCTWDQEAGVFTAKVDDLGRPIVKLRKHDFELGGFREITARYGADSVERVTLEMIEEELRQQSFPFVAAGESSNGDPVVAALVMVQAGQLEEARIYVANAGQEAIDRVEAAIAEREPTKPKRKREKKGAAF